MNKNLWLGGLILISLIGCGASSEVKEITVTVAQPQTAHSGGQRIYIDPNTGLPTTPPNNQGITPPLPPINDNLIEVQHPDGSVSIDLSNSTRFINAIHATEECSGHLGISHTQNPTHKCNNAPKQDKGAKE